MGDFSVHSPCKLAAGVTVFVAMAVLLLGIAAAGTPSGGSKSPAVEWSLDARLVVPDGEIAELGTRAATVDNVDALISKLNARGFKTEKRILGSDERGIVYGLKASGSGDLQGFRTLIHSVAKPQFNLLGGVTEIEIESGAAESGGARLILESNHSTGHAWHVAEESGMVPASAHTFEKHTPGYGVPERQILPLAPGKAGTPVRLVYKRAWEDSAPTRQLKLKLASMPATLDLSDPNAPATAPAAPAGRVNTGAFPVVSAGALPSHFDWRDQGIVPPVRDQGMCGSCWAFGTVGIMESSLGKNGAGGVNLSEQFLVSCNKDGWSCNGGLTAHKYHYNALGKAQTTVGAVLESVNPYSGTNGTCSGEYQKAYRLTGWKSVAGSESAIPTDDQIKSAIYTYGPVTAGVCAGSGWDYYTISSGVFATDEASECGRYANHQIILVGWDDSEQCWILRNSWGTGWGMDGYMLIRYGISRVGEGTSWVTTGSSAYTLTVSKSGSGTVVSVPSGIDCGSTCSYSFSEGASVVLTAAAPSGSAFTGWSGACSGTGTCTVVMNINQNVTATFAPCLYTVTPAGKTFPSFRAAGSRIAVTAPPGCPAPSVTPNEAWIHASAPSFNVRAGRGALTVSVDANSASSLPRSGNVVIGDKTVPVTQAGRPCAVTLGPSSLTVAAGESADAFMVTASLTDCAWTAAAADSTAASWLTNVSPNSGTGSGTVSYSVGANPSNRPRIGRISVLYNGGKARKVYTVRQSGG